MSVDRTAAVLQVLGVTEPEIAACVPLTGGTYNTISRVTLTDGRDWVVKIPPAQVAGLSYERDLLVNEVTFCTVAPAVGGAAIPQVVHSELDTRSAAGAYLVMSLCPGRPWHELAGELSGSEEQRLRGEFGQTVGRLHTVTGPAGFGYPAESVGPLADSWREAFTAMTGAVLADAVRYAARLPRPVAEIRRLLESASYVLDDVTRPALVHFDLWQGNLLVDGESGARRLSGIIDGERMFWGDPVADFVSVALFGDVEKDRDFLAGYARGAGGPVEFTASVRLRLALYRCYLYLIMLTETVPRRPAAKQLEWTWREVAPRLVAALAELESASLPRGGVSGGAGESGQSPGRVVTRRDVRSGE